MAHVNCRGCGAAVDGADQFCSYCGLEVVQPVVGAAPAGGFGMIAPPPPPPAPPPQPAPPPPPAPPAPPAVTTVMPAQAAAQPAPVSVQYVTMPTAKASKAPWFVAAGAIVVAAAAIAAVLIVRGGDDSAQTSVTTLDRRDSSDDTRDAETATGDTASDGTTGDGTGDKATDTTLPFTTPSNTPATSPATPAPTAAAPTAAAAYPGSVPSGRCNADAIEADTGLRPYYTPTCIGAWVLTMVNECPADADCESGDVFRWTDGGWTYRGVFYAMCAPALAAAGMPPSIGVEFVGTWDACDWEKYTVPEPSTGALELADEGPRVRALQLALIQRGLLFDVADGQFGPNTEAAVIDLQYLTGLDPDGIAGAATHAKLGLPYA